LSGPDGLVALEVPATDWLPDRKYGFAVELMPAAVTGAELVAPMARPVTGPESVARTVTGSSAGSCEGQTTDCVPVTGIKMRGAVCAGTYESPTAIRATTRTPRATRHARDLMRHPPGICDRHGSRRTHG